MQEKNINFGCCLDCFGNCSMVATVKDDKIIKIEGNKHHPLTQGVICVKGRKHLERVYHPDRILSPKRKVNGKWVDISYEEALEEICSKLLSYKTEYGSESVLLFSSGGYSGINKSVDEMFFNYYGGVKHFALEGEEIPWKDGKFDTPSGKYELYSETAKNQGLSPLPEYIP